MFIAQIGVVVLTGRGGGGGEGRGGVGSHYPGTHVQMAILDII